MHCLGPHTLGPWAEWRPGRGFGQAGSLARLGVPTVDGKGGRPEKIDPWAQQVPGDERLLPGGVSHAGDRVERDARDFPGDAKADAASPSERPRLDAFDSRLLRFRRFGRERATAR